MRPEDILQTYQRVAGGWSRTRDKTLYERRWLDRLLTHAPGREILDLGCGSGLPIARYLTDRRASITGVDGAEAMVALFRRNLPAAEAIHADMRGLSLGRRFDAVIAWNSFFHLSADDQRAMFAVFADHAGARAVLLFTSGPEAGEAIGEVEGEQVYHASLAPDEYQSLLEGAGFELLAFIPEDPECNGHSVWMARRVVSA